MSPGQKQGSNSPRRLEYQMRPLPTEGALADYPLAEVLYACQFEQLSGMLRLRHEAVERVVYILKGDPAFIESDLAKENLGYFLLEQGRLAADEHRLIHETMRQTGQRQADLLLEQGFLNPHELYEVLSQYVTEKVVSCFAWKEGTFAVERGDAWRDQIVRFSIDASRLLLDGVCAHGRGGGFAVLEGLPEKGTLYLRAQGTQPQELALTTLESRILTLAREGASLAQVAAALSDHAGLARPLLYGLFVLGIVGFDTTEKPAAPVAKPAEITPPAAPPIPAVSAPRIIERIEKEYERTQNADYFATLGIAPGVDTTAVHQAFRALSPPFRPENVQDLPQEAREKAGQVFIKMLQAYRLLADSEGRREYARQLRRQRGSLVADAAALGAVSSSGAESRFRRAQRDLEAERLTDGLAALGELVKEWPDELRYQAWHIWAQFLDAPEGFRREAESRLARLSRRDPDLAEPYALMARIFEHEGALDQARRLYALGQKRIPGHVPLTREARLFEARVKKGTPRKWAAQTANEPASALDQDVGALVGRVVDSLKKKLSR
jgi:curved DNA-binding protein CbpA